MREDFDRRMLGPRLTSAIASGVGLLTLALACLGIFGVVSYGVALRTKEIGIRVALGAQQPALFRAIVRQVLTPVGVGVVIGLALAIPAGLALGTEPFYLESTDPVTIAAALAVFAGRRRRRGSLAGVPGAAAQSRASVAAFVGKNSRLPRQFPAVSGA